MTDFAIPLEKLGPKFDLADAVINRQPQWANLMPLAKASFDYFLAQNFGQPLLVCQAASYLQSPSLLQALLSPHCQTNSPGCAVMLYQPGHPYQPLCLQLEPGTLALFNQLMQQLEQLIHAQVTNQHFSRDSLERLYQSLINCQRQAGLVDAVKSLYQYLVSQATVVDLSDYLKVWQMVPQAAICNEFSRAALFGYNWELNPQKTDLQGIQFGLLQQVLEGALVLNANDILADLNLWFELKACLKSQQLCWSRAQGRKVKRLPQPLPFRPKIVLLGEPLAIAELYELDPDIIQLSLIETELPQEIEVQPANLGNYLSQVNASLNDINLPALNEQLYQSVLSYASRLCEHKGLLSLDLHSVCKPLQLLNHLQLEPNAQGFAEALAIISNNINSQQQFSDLAYRDQQNKIVLSGEEVGQINGLSVIDFNGLGLSFGEPIRITATTYQGEGDFTDVERKAELGGNIHAKSMMIIQAYLSELFAKDHHFPLSGNIVFEQSYHEIDGDSASLAGALVMLSALANQPIPQNSAVTGALDQKGNVLAVGGINEKIEGFYRITQQTKAEGPFAVILPKANLNQLNLSSQVRLACEQAQLKLYAIEHIEQAVELLFKRPAGDIYDEQSVYGKTHRSIYGEHQGRHFLFDFFKKLLNVFKL